MLFWKRSISTQKFISLRKFSSQLAESNGPVKSELSNKTVQTVTTVKSRGSTFFERLSSFLVGCAIGFGSISYFIYNELNESNEKFGEDLKSIDKRLERLENSKK